MTCHVDWRAPNLQNVRLFIKYGVHEDAPAVICYVLHVKVKSSFGHAQREEGTIGAYAWTIQTSKT